MKSSVFLLPFLTFVLFCHSGCSDTTTPNVDPKLVLKLEIVESSVGEGHVRAEAVVENIGGTPVHYVQACTSPVYISLLDVNGVELLLNIPLPAPGCIGSTEKLLPNQSLNNGQELIWAFDELMNSYPIPPGAYTVRAAFGYSILSGDTPVRMVREMPIELK